MKVNLKFLIKVFFSNGFAQKQREQLLMIKTEEGIFDEKDDVLKLTFNYFNEVWSNTDISNIAGDDQDAYLADIKPLEKVQ